MIDPFSIIIGLTILSFFLLIAGFILSQSLGTILILLGIGLLIFNGVYYYLDKSDPATKMSKLPKGFVCTNCGSKLEQNISAEQPIVRYCASCGYKASSN